MVIWLVNFLYTIVFLLLMIVMSKVATDRFGVSPAMAGLSASIFVIGSFAVRPFLAPRIHQIGQVRILYIGTILSLALTLAYFWANSSGLLMLVRFLHGAIGLTTAAGIFFVVYAVVIFFTRPLVGRRFDAQGENSVMYAAIIIFALGLVILAVATRGSVLLLAAAFLGLGFGSLQACGRAVTVKVTPRTGWGRPAVQPF